MPEIYWTLKCTKLRVATIVKQDAVNRVPHHVQIVGLNKLTQVSDLEFKQFEHTL